MTERSFKSKPLNALNLEYEQFKSKVLEVAFQSPEEFFNLRRQLMKNLLEDSVKAMYEMVFNALTEPKDIVNFDSLTKAAATFEGEFKPKMSEQKADEIALDMVAGLKELLKKHVVDELLPPDVFRSSLQRAGKAAAMAVGSDEP